MKNLVLIGGGGHCKSVLDAALSMNVFNKIVITDADAKPGTFILGCEVVGNDDILMQLKQDGFDYAFITVGSIKSCKLRKSLALKANELGYLFPVIKDPTAVISKFAKLGEGTFVGKKTVINADSFIGNHCIINTGAIIEHECHIGDFSHISVGSILCGNVEIGRECFIGAGSTIIQSKNIGKNTIIGANSTVLSDVKDHSLAYHIINTPPGLV